MRSAARERRMSVARATRERQVSGTRWHSRPDDQNRRWALHPIPDLFRASHRTLTPCFRPPRPPAPLDPCGACWRAAAGAPAPQPPGSSSTASIAASTQASDLTKRTLSRAGMPFAWKASVAARAWATARAHPDTLRTHAHPLRHVFTFALARVPRCGTCASESRCLSRPYDRRWAVAASDGQPALRGEEGPTKKSDQHEQ